MQYLCQLLVCDVGSVLDLLEGIIIWDKDSDVGQVLQWRNDVDLCSCASKCCEAAGDESLRDTQWNKEELVDDVDNTIVEFDILQMLMRILYKVLLTYGNSHLARHFDAGRDNGVGTSSRLTETTCPPVTLLPLTSPSSTMPE